MDSIFPILPVGSGVREVTQPLGPQRVSDEERTRQQRERERKRRQRQNAAPPERRVNGDDGSSGPRIDIVA
jgi:hypothetical protein